MLPWYGDGAFKQDRKTQEEGKYTPTLKQLPDARSEEQKTKRQLSVLGLDRRRREMPWGGDRKPRNIQKNIHVNLYLSPGNHIGVSHHQNGSAELGSKQMGATIKGMLRAASLRSGVDKPHQSHLVQTNLSCPYWPSQQTTSDSVCQKQSNLNSKLQRFGLGNKAGSSSPHPLLPVHSLCLGQLGLERNPPRNLLRQSHDVPSARDATCKDRMGSKDKEVSKWPLGHFSNPRSSRNLETHQDASSSSRCLEKPYQASLHHNSCPSPTSPYSGADLSSPGPALTLDHLKTSDVVENHPSSTTLKAILKSSQRSADLHGSIQRLQQETGMGALGSFPWESKYSSLPRPPCASPPGSASAPLSIMERLAAEQNYTRQAGVKWGASFGRDWGGLGSTVGAFGEGEPLPLTSRYKTAGLYPPATETLDHCWPTGFPSSIGPASLLVPGKEASFSYVRPCSGGQRVLEETVSCGWPKTECYQRTHGPEDPSSGVSHCSELGQKNLPLGVLSTGGLEVSSETLHDKDPGNMRVSVYNSQREGHLTTWSPGGPEVVPVHQFGNGSKDLDPCEPGESGWTRLTATSVDACSSFLLQWESGAFGAAAAKEGLRERSEAQDGTHIVSPTTFVAGSSRGSSNPVCDGSWPNVGGTQIKESSMAKAKEKMELPCSERRDYGIAATQKEDLERNNGSMDKKRNRPLPRRRDPLLVKSFVAWHDHTLEKKAAARALYERQLKRKGLAALQWAVQLRNVQAGIAQRSHALAVLAASFRRWQDAAAKQREAQTPGRKEPASCGQSLQSPLGREGLTQHPILSQLSSEHREEASRYSRAEGSLWMQLRHVQGTDELCRKAKALRDVRRLAAAFRLWRLQKERLEREEACAQEVRTLLEKKKLANAFQTWRSRYRASKQTWLLAARIQRGLIGRCFDAWKRFAQREAVSRQGLECLRARSLRMCFRQWARMVEVKQKARGVLLELLALKQRKSHVRLGIAPDTCMAQPCLTVTRWSQRNGGDSIDGLLRALALQDAFQTWRTRWWESQLAMVFSRALAQHQLREVLGWWRWKTLALNPLGLKSGHLAEDRLLASPDDSEESSLSSGFHSGGTAPTTSSGSLGKENLEDSSRASVSSWATMEDLGLLPHHDPSSLEDLINVALESHPKAPQAPYNYHMAENPFQEMRFLNPGGEGKPILAPLVQKGARAGDNPMEVQNQRKVLARYFGLWSASTCQNQKASQHRRHTLLSRAFSRWATAVAHSSTWREAQASLERARRQRLLVFYFGRWKTAFLAASQQRQNQEIPPGRPEAGYRALRRWRKAARGYRALRLSSMNQAGNYWTRAAAFRRCCRQRSSLIGPHKFTKLFPTWPGRQRWNREKDVHPGSGTQPSLTCSSFRVWLMTYRSQRRTLWAQEPPEGVDVTGGRSRCPWARESSSEADSAAGERQRLGGKYLRVWRHGVLLRRFQAAIDSRRLVNAWMLWKDTCRTKLLVEALARQRLAEWSWKTWRRRCLQSWVAERFLTTDNRRLLQRAFGRWRQLAAASRMETNVHF